MPWEYLLALLLASRLAMVQRASGGQTCWRSATVDREAHVAPGAKQAVEKELEFLSKVQSKPL
jgi:hypothetical protein